MNSTEQQGKTPADIEFAAGGLVWSQADGSPTLAVVHRPRHGDWTLPKGRLKPGEAMEDAALREAMEETGRQATLERFAGSYSYRKGHRSKLVLIWHMTRQAEACPHPAPKEEVDEVRWLSVTEAIRRLTHPLERELVARNAANPGNAPKRQPSESDPRRSRLRAAVQTTGEKVRAAAARSPAGGWWLDSALRSMEVAENSGGCGDLDGGWGALHDAERFLVYGMGDAELIAHAASVKAETEAKLRNWRASATKTLFASAGLEARLKAGPPLKTEERTVLQQAVVESLNVLNAHSDNLYHRMGLVQRQLDFLVLVCGILVATVLFGSYFFAEADSKLGMRYLAPIAIAGALGGVVSAMIQLSRVGEARIPEALLYGLITSGRPLVGGASGLFIYFVMQSGLISLVDAAKVGLEAGLVVAFVAGFSERLVLSAVSKVAGSEKDGSSGGGSRGKARQNDSEGVETTDAFDNDGDDEGESSVGRKTGKAKLKTEVSRQAQRTKPSDHAPGLPDVPPPAP